MPSSHVPVNPTRRADLNQESLIYVEGDLRPRARRRLDRHARGCVDCGRGIRAMRALVYAAHGLGGLAGVRAPETIFDRARSGGPGGAPSSSRA
jgi:hypothetical protein